MTVITLTEEAKDHILAVLQRRGLCAVRLGLAPQGCNGYKYTWDPVPTNMADHVIDLGDEYFLVFNNDIVPYIIGSEVVVEDTGLMSKQLTLKNPNIAGSCGCGESVNFK